jgi:ergothioneine biosynthesis protein EgtB
LTPLDSLAFEAGPPVMESFSAERPKGWGERFSNVRTRSRRIAAPLSPEDMTPQSMPDASPAKWHLAHTTWFFETFVLIPRGVVPFDPRFQYLFNSYYEALGARAPRPARGLITRPDVSEVMAYREHVDRRMADLLVREVDDELAALLELGFAHEEQHQELMLTDLLHLFSRNSLKPAYQPARGGRAKVAGGTPETYTDVPGGVISIGWAGQGFAFDNEGPRHEVLLKPFRLADRSATNADWLDFMADGGYRRAELWLSDGWALRQAEGWEAPLYWEWRAFGLHGLQPLEPGAPVCHVSFFEADAYARWREARLPTEAEWETAAARAGHCGAWLDDWALTPQPARGGSLGQMFGDVWEWTSSPYVGYPGFRPASGAVGEYNGKFMINQMILRGGSCVTPAGHVRASYRNFFQPHQRWQFSGVRLAQDA